MALAVAPGDTAGPFPSGFVYDIVAQLEIQQIPLYQSMPGIINVTADVIATFGKTVIILDDVWTSGPRNKLLACRDAIAKTSPKDVKLFAIGKTV